ncbi:thiol-disulfide isomerase/thioredoxin [Chitinophaga niastensis]|uniref:Thiol-disulfide isomerase/thioredoxin n=1 Tax=Chitinophaga niastensis TaxID=536980 RepID=A0A2P8HA11_CHINA|nr:TlpA disulfide reductase family protein [Chitinophaga niastensis]PSL43058.1 thiol-disulfide isomerase/thioredoxin [Chitinophaga niastensis]
MKKKPALIYRMAAALICFSLSTAVAQENKSQQKLPNVQVKDLEGKLVNVSTFSNNGKPVIISFWATWCKPCISELESIADDYDNWKKTTGVKLIAISIDDARTSAGIKSLVSSRGWQYEVYNDYNKELYRALGIANVPYTVILNGDGAVVERHAGYNPGDEYHLLEAVKKISGL